MLSIFAGFTYKTGGLLTKDGLSPQKLGGQLRALLERLLSSPRIAVSREELKMAVWRHSEALGTENLDNLVSRLRKVLADEDKTLIKTEAGVGYSLQADVTIKPEAAMIPIESREFPVFPGHGTPSGSLFIHSWVGHGARDSVDYVTRSVRWEPTQRQMALLSPHRRDTILLPFTHHSEFTADGECWWSASVAANIDVTTGDWRPFDCKPFQLLTFEARALGPDAQASGIPLCVRLEDHIINQNRVRNSTGWHPHPIVLIPDFRCWRLRLDDFNWNGWPNNSAPADRSAVIQITFGQDDQIRPCAGQIEITQIRFSKMETN